MLNQTRIKRDFDASYLKSQERILVGLISQIAPGYAKARLEIELRHTRDCLAAPNRSCRCGAVG